MKTKINKNRIVTANPKKHLLTVAIILVPYLIIITSFVNNKNKQTEFASPTENVVSTDKENVSHEELSYIVDSTASPIATLIPLNAWPAYIGGLVVLGSIQQYIPNEDAGMTYFLKAIPFNFYAILSVLFTFLISMS